MTPEQEQFYNNCTNSFDYYQKYQVSFGFRSGLSIEQVKVYAKKEFSDMQMWEMRLGFHNRLIIEQVLLYARPDLTWEQMEEIREMFRKYDIEMIKTKVAVMLLES